MLRFRNTLTGELEPFIPLEEGRVRIYACGPTVWNFAHIGNFKTFVFYDVLRRYLRFRGFEVTEVMNVTDVDDRIIEQTIELKLSLEELTTKYLNYFLEDMATLNIEQPEVMPKATEHIPEMVALVETLLANGKAYEADGSIYFKISAFDGYGKLSGKKLEGNEAGRSGRVDTQEYAKADTSDFVLWKAPKLEGERSWDTAIGTGRPGWHLECSAMSMKYLGETFDIHAGGEDLIFPHHENEIAQSEGATGKPFARYWLHSKFLNIENQKMSKRFGNFKTPRDLLSQGIEPMAIRYLLLSAPYRTQLNFTADGLDAAASSLDRLRNFVRRIRNAHVTSNGESPASAVAKRMLEGFQAAMDDDLNTSVALAAVFNLVNDVNPMIDAKSITEADRAAILSAIDRVDGVFGVLSLTDDEAVPEEIHDLVTQRTEARRARNFALADEMRDRIVSAGYVIEDSPDGTKVRKK
ncbi:MAG: cysteine--tRNA ligase [Blastocatellia bacterium]|jgi:cysteinyl-tRNA synthetase